jgi:hypothetical protein
MYGATAIVNDSPPDPSIPPSMVLISTTRMTAGMAKMQVHFADRGISLRARLRMLATETHSILSSYSVSLSYAANDRFAPRISALSLYRSWSGVALRRRWPKPISTLAAQ